MKFTKFSLLFALLTVICMGFAGCSETEEPSEYDNWPARNLAWLQNVADSAVANLTDETHREAGKWLILKQYSLVPDKGTPTITPDNLKDYVYVKILSSGNSTSGSPLYTDTVKVDYRGYLMPTDSYPEGLVFDQSYGGDFDEQTNVPSIFPVKGVVNGWQTALQHMQVGDRWVVYIPQELAYGTEAKSGIPAYSTLRFDMHLSAFRHFGEKDWTTK